MNTNENIKLEIIDKNNTNSKRKDLEDNKSKNNKSEERKVSLDDNLDKQTTKIQENINRCMTCNKKIGLTGFQCKCKYYFCAEHRYSDRHDCKFDYKQLGKNLLEKANPKIISSKVDLI